MSSPVQSRSVPSLPQRHHPFLRHAAMLLASAGLLAGLPALAVADESAPGLQAWHHIIPEQGNQALHTLQQEQRQQIPRELQLMPVPQQWSDARATPQTPPAQG